MPESGRLRPAAWGQFRPLRRYSCGYCPTSRAAPRHGSNPAPALHLLNGRNRPTASTRLNVPNYEAADVGRWAWGYFGGVGLLWRRGATCWRRGATCWRRGATCWRAILVLGLALLLTALGAALLVTGFAVLLLLPGTLAVVPPIITAITPGGLRIRGCCDHHASACEKR